MMGPGGPGGGPMGEMPMMGMMGPGAGGMMGGAQPKQAKKPKRKKRKPPMLKPAGDPFLSPNAVEVRAPTRALAKPERRPLPKPLQIPPLAVAPPSYAPTGVSLSKGAPTPRAPKAETAAAPAGPPPGARVAGIATDDRVMAIINVGGKSIVVKPGDPLDPVIEGAYVERIEPTGVVVRKGEETFVIPARGG